MISFCPKCGFRLDKDFKFCPSCGMDLSSIESGSSAEKSGIQEIEITVIKCNNCGEENTLSARICKGCGIKL